MVMPKPAEAISRPLDAVGDGEGAEHHDPG